MRPHVRAIDINALAQKVEVDNRISLPFYYRIADNLLKQVPFPPRCFDFLSQFLCPSS